MSSTMVRPHRGLVMIINRHQPMLGLPLGAHFRILSEHGMGFVLAEKMSHYGEMDVGWERVQPQQLPRYIVLKSILSPLNE